MQVLVDYDTPENVAIRYRLAGPGSRFLAFFIDVMLLVVGYLALALIGLIVVFVAGPESPIAQQFAGIDPAAVGAVLVVVTGLGFLVYFIAFELAMAGQTPGKRMTACRVVREHGFSLTFQAILIRGIFRIIDTIPMLWIVPVLSSKFQRFGDMAAGTIVIMEEPTHVSPMRELLATRIPSEAVFPYTPADAARHDPKDVHGMELYCEYRGEMHPEHRERTLGQILDVVLTRLGYDQPVAPNQRDRFIEDLLAAHYRREAHEAL